MPAASSRLRSWLILGLLALCPLPFGCRAAPGAEVGPKSPTKVEAETPSSELGALAPGEPLSLMAVEADDARLGADDASVTLVAFLDFECGFCARGFSVLGELRQKYSPDELRIVVKHLPLDSHPMAVPAAIAGQAVTDRGGSEAFFAFAERAFASQGNIDFSGLARFAQEAGVPRAVYEESVTDFRTAEKIEQDLRTAARASVDGTPAFFVNGRRFTGSQPLETFTEAIDAELEHMNADTASPRTERYRARIEKNLALGLVDALLARDGADYRAPVDGSAVRGDRLAPVTIVAFGDYQCPYCQRGARTLDEVFTRYAGTVRIVQKHLPLDFHPEARPAARLAEAVRRKSGDAAFFEVDRRLYERGPGIDRPFLIELGKTSGLVGPEFERLLDGGDTEIEARIDRDLLLADDLGARGTPHFFVNGKRLAGARPFAHFEALIELGRSRAAKLLAAGTSPELVYDELQKDAETPLAPEAFEGAIDEAGRPARGPRDAPITVHVFSDFECPYCRQVEETLGALDRAHPGQLRFVWHDAPLPFHDHARPAARAAREALRQGGTAAFWKMHDAIFALDGDRALVEHAELVKLAKELGLDVARFERALDDGSADAPIEADLAQASELGFSGTPTIVVGGYVVRGARPLAHFERIVALVTQGRARR